MEAKPHESSEIKIDDIINNFYDSLLPNEATIIPDFPKEQFPHNVNLRIKVVRREEINDILNPKSPPPEIEVQYDENLDFYNENNEEMLSGAKRVRNGYDDNYSPTGNTFDGIENKRAKFYE